MIFAVELKTAVQETFDIYCCALQVSVFKELYFEILVCCGHLRISGSEMTALGTSSEKVSELAATGVGSSTEGHPPKKAWSAIVKSGDTNLGDKETAEQNGGSEVRPTVDVETPAQSSKGGKGRNDAHEVICLKEEKIGQQRTGSERGDSGKEAEEEKRDSPSSSRSSMGGEGAKSEEGKKNKPAWNVITDPPSETPTPAPDGATVSWPSLVDSKAPLPKKKQREQAAAAAAAANIETQQKTKGKREKKSKEGKDSGDGSTGKTKASGRNRRGKSGQKSGDFDHEGPKQKGKGQYGKGNRGGMGAYYGNQKGMQPAMAYGAAPMMYAPATPVFYPPAAYGITTNVESVMDALRNQINYYFSEANLAKDMFLRKKMDSQGWVEIEVIAAFNRVRMLTPDLSIIASALSASETTEVSSDGMFLRPRVEYERWILPEEQRDANLKSPQPVETKSGKVISNKDDSKEDVDRDEDDVFQLDEEHEVESTMSDAQISKLIVVKPSTRKKKSALSAQLESSKDEDMKNVINDGLEMYGQELRKTTRGAASNPRPVANGHRQGKNNMHANFYPASLGQSYTGRMKQGGKGSYRPSVAVGWVLGSTPDAHGGIMSPTSRRQGSYLGSSAPIQKFQHPSYELLEENGFTEMKYEKFHDRCIAERAEKGVGLSEEMNTLFRFWCYFLRDHFNQAMYEDFKKYASDDSEQGYQYGIECLFRFFSYGLETHFRASLYKEFEEYVLKDHKAGHLYGLEKFWAYHHYHGLPKDSNVEMNPELKALLETDFKSIDDFKAKRERNYHHHHHQHQ